MKIRCPHCREKVQPGALRCPHCLQNFDTEFVAYSRHALLASRVTRVFVLVGVIVLLLRWLNLIVF